VYFNEALEVAKQNGFTRREDTNKLQDGVYPWRVVTPWSSMEDIPDHVEIVDADGTVSCRMYEV